MLLSKNFMDFGTLSNFNIMLKIININPMCHEGHYIP